MDSEIVFTWIQQHIEKVRDYFSVMQRSYEWLLTVLDKINVGEGATLQV